MLSQTIKSVNKIPKRKNDSNDSKKNVTSKTNMVSEVQVSDSDQGMDIEDNDNDSMGLRILPDIVTTFEDSDSCDTDGIEWLGDSFCGQNHTISNPEYENLKWSNFAIKLLSIEPITALFDTVATYSCISQQLFIKISDKANMVTKSLKVNTASGVVLGSIGITHLELNIDDQIFVYNFIMCTKLKQPLILGLNFFFTNLGYEYTGTCVEHYF